MEHKRTDSRLFLFTKLHVKEMFFGFLLVMTFFINKKSFLFWVLTLLCAIFDYYHDKYNKTIFDMRLGLFGGVIIARYYGLFPAILFYVLSSIVPNVLAGGRLDGPTLVFHVLYIILFGITTWFNNADLIILGLLMVLTDGVLGVFINMALGLPSFMAITAALFAVTIRIIYFLTLGRLIIFIYQFI
ncbi:MAG: hypothetical protein ABIJ34_03555 [archaeon]